MIQYKFRRTIASVAAVLLLNGHALAASPEATPMKALRWDASNEAGLRAALPNLEAASSFVRSVLTKPAYTYDYAKISAFTFVDLEGNGRLSLVRRMNTGGREVNSLLAVITPSREGYQYDVISSEGFELPELSSVIVDLKHDGRKELLIRTLEDSRPQPLNCVHLKVLEVTAGIVAPLGW